MNEKTENLWSLKETSEIFFSGDDIRIPVNTIQTWQKRKIFSPYEPAKHRDPRGSRCSLSDLVVLSLFYLLLKIGLRFENLRFIEEDELTHEIAGVFRRKLQRPLSDILGIFSTDGFAPEESKALKQALRLKRRPIQTYLEITRYACFLKIITRPSVDPSSHVLRFDPITKEEGESGLCTIRAFPSFGPHAITVIDVRPHYDRIVEILGLPKVRSRVLDKKITRLENDPKRSAAEVEAVKQELMQLRAHLESKGTSDHERAITGFCETLLLVETHGDEKKEAELVAAGVLAGLEERLREYLRENCAEMSEAERTSFLNRVELRMLVEAAPTFLSRH